MRLVHCYTTDDKTRIKLLRCVGSIHNFKSTAKGSFGTYSADWLSKAEHSLCGTIRDDNSDTTASNI